MSPLLDLSIRVLAAAFVGAIIGYEREIRAKGAGMRTHVLVALGSALFMIVSQFGFEGAPRFDAARVAAGVVGGLGFLGGGIIMKTKNHVSGLTTAAGLWVTGSLGLALGCGMYALSGSSLETRKSTPCSPRRTRKPSRKPSPAWDAASRTTRSPSRKTATSSKPSCTCPRKNMG